MKLLTFSTEQDGPRRLGACLDGNNIVDLARAYSRIFSGQAPDWFGSVTALLRGGDKALELAREVMDRVGRRTDADVLHDMDSIAFHPPISGSPKVLCVTMNYRSHAQASLTKPSDEPYFFIKLPNVLTAHRAPVLCSKTSQKCDSEIELAVIIGRRGKYIPREQAMDYVAGYTIANDFSFRDRRSLKSDPNSARLHWLTLKNLDTAAPIGPCLVTKDEVRNPYDLDITLTLENEPQEYQSGNTSGMMHRIEDLIHHASNGLTLEPGDVILTGTPHDVAFGHQRFLRDGDVLRAEISGLGVLINPVKAE